MDLNKKIIKGNSIEVHLEKLFPKRKKHCVKGQQSNRELKKLLSMDFKNDTQVIQVSYKN